MYSKKVDLGKLILIPLSDPRLVQAGGSKFQSVKDWWNAKLDEAIAAAELEQQQRADQNSKSAKDSGNGPYRYMREREHVFFFFMSFTF